MNNDEPVKHQRQCMHCDMLFETTAKVKEYISCPKCEAGTFPTQYFQNQVNYYKELEPDEDKCGWLAMRDSIASYCRCHNAALCFEHNMHAPHDKNCHNKVLQIACLDLNSFLEKENYDSLSQKLEELKDQVALIQQNQ